MTDDGMKRKLKAIFSADVKSYSKLMGDDEESTVKTITAYREIIAELVDKHQGWVVDSPGDNILAEFDSALNAVSSAIEIQDRLETENSKLPDNRRMEFRIGINLGDILHKGDRIYGNGVNVAARIESLADPGGICITRGVYDQVKKNVCQGFEYLGEHLVKNIAEPVRIYRILLEPEFEGQCILKSNNSTFKIKKPTAVILSILLIASAAILWMFYPRSAQLETASMKKMAFPLPDKPSIAVLPFANISGDQKQDYISDGITEQIITSLSKIPHLFVIARNSTFTYKGQPVKVQKVAEDLGVRYVLEGSVQTSDEQIRITAQLIDAIDGTYLWAEHYDKNLEDIFVLQDEITMNVIKALQIKLTKGEYAHTIARSTFSLKALECFWIAEYHWMRITKKENTAARRWIEKAIELDPNFSSAWSLLGFVHIHNILYGWSDNPDYSFMEMERCAQKALLLDSSNPKANCVMSWNQYLQLDYDQAIVYGKKAVELAPSDHSVLGGLGYIMVCAGQHEEGIRLTKKGMRLNPYYEDYFLENLGDAYFFLGQYNESLNAYKTLIDRNPYYGNIQFKVAGVYSELGRQKEAKIYANEALKSNPNFNIESLSKEWPLKRKKER